VVRLAAGVLQRDDYAGVAAIWKAAKRIRFSLGALTVILLVVFRDPVSSLLLGGAQHSAALLLLPLAVALLLAVELGVSLLTAYHRTGTVAVWAALNAVLGSAASVAVLLVLGTRGIPLAIVAGALMGWVVAATLQRGVAGGLRSVRTGPGRVTEAGRHLIAFGAPYTASQLVGAGVILLIPALTLATVGRPQVGYYQAAFAIANNYIGFLAAAMSADYYPRVSAAREAPRMLKVVNEQHTLVMILGLPVILLALAAAPYMVPLIYTPAFAPATPVLNWMLLADMFMFSGWTLSFLILARGGGLAYFGVELFWGVAHLATAWLGLRWYGVVGVGVSWLVTSIAYLVVVYCVAWRRWRLSVSRNNVLLIATAVFITVAVSLSMSSSLEAARLGTLAVCAAVTAIVCGFILHVTYGLEWRQVLSPTGWMGIAQRLIRTTRGE
jgi:PST family polysaccharide transporter